MKTIVISFLSLFFLVSLNAQSKKDVSKKIQPVAESVKTDAKDIKAPDKPEVKTDPISIPDTAKVTILKDRRDLDVLNTQFLAAQVKEEAAQLEEKSTQASYITKQTVLQQDIDSIFKEANVDKDKFDIDLDKLEFVPKSTKKQ